MTAEPLVTVLIAAYSYEQHFKATLDSVLNQTARGLMKIVVYDNGSKPSYRDLILELSKTHGFEVVRAERNRYGQGSRMDVLPFLTTPFLATIHDDDCYTSDKVAKSLEFTRSNEFDVVFNNLHFIDADGQDIDTRVSHEANFKPLRKDETRGSLIYDVFWPGQRLHYSSLFMKTSVAKQTLLGDPFYPRIADSIYWTELLLDPALKIGILEEKLSLIRLHGANDRLMSKFSRREKSYENFVHFKNEDLLFRRVLDVADTELLLDFINAMHFVSKRHDDLVEGLLEVSVLLSKSDIDNVKSQLAVALFHRAYKENPLRACQLIEKMTRKDANAYTIQLYQQQFSEYHAKIMTYYSPLVLLLAPGPGRLKSLAKHQFGVFIWNPGMAFVRKLIPKKFYVRLRNAWRSRFKSKIRSVNTLDEKILL